MSEEKKFEPGYRLWLIEEGILVFLFSSIPGSLGGSKDFPEIRISADGVRDGVEHLGWCLTALRQDGVLPMEVTELKELSSSVSPLDMDQLAYDGVCPGEQTIRAVGTDGTEYVTYRVVPYY